MASGDSLPVKRNISVREEFVYVDGDVGRMCGRYCRDHITIRVVAVDAPKDQRKIVSLFLHQFGSFLGIFAIRLDGGLECHPEPQYRLFLAIVAWMT